jgi:hypothetical protein
MSLIALAALIAPTILVVWAAPAVGLSATTFIVGGFTFLE